VDDSVVTGSDEERLKFRYHDDNSIS
jgi:hypothetical protein